MGLFSSILKIGATAAGAYFGGPQGAALGNSLASSITGGGKSSKNANQNAINQAALLQAGAAQAGIDEQGRQFDITQANLSPWLTAGAAALGGQQDLLGLNGFGAQQGSIDSLRQSPAFESRWQAGQDAILANGAATGGLRGGNIQNSLATFRSDTLADVIQRQLAGLGALSSGGQQTGVQLGGFGANNAGSIAELLQQQAAAKAGGILGSQAVGNQAQSGLTSSLGQFFGSQGGQDLVSKFGSLFSGGGGGSPMFGGGSQGQSGGVLSYGGMPGFVF